jgi:hypothetical protein
MITRNFIGRVWIDCFKGRGGDDLKLETEVLLEMDAEIFSSALQ